MMTPGHQGGNGSPTDTHRSMWKLTAVDVRVVQPLSGIHFSTAPDNSGSITGGTAGLR